MQCTEFGDRNSTGEKIEPRCFVGTGYFYPSSNDIMKFCKTENFKDCPRFRLR